MKFLVQGSLLVLTAVATLAAVKTDYDHSIGFEKYHTFAWRTPRSASFNSARLNMGDNTLLRARMTRAINEQLTAKGMQEDSKNPDVYLSYRFVAVPRHDLMYFPGPGWGWGWGWGWRRGAWSGPDLYTDHYTQGTFTINMIDAKTNQLIWRAYGTDTGSNPLDVQSEKNVDKIVSQALKHFPPKDRHAG